MGKLADIAQKTQQAYGTPAVEINEIRAAGELETIKEPKEPDPNAKLTDKDPLNGDGDSDQNRDTDSTAQ